MSVGVPGSYRSLDWRGRYTPEQVAVWFPAAFGNDPWVSREATPARCRYGAGKCSHDCETDEFDEGCTVDGEYKVCQHRHGGHGQCGKCVCVDPTSRRSTDNRDPDGHVTVLDMTKAWARARADAVISEALYLHHGLGLTQEEIAAIQGVSRQAVSLRLRAGHLAIADFLNGENQ
jgi:hypothetical protein